MTVREQVKQELIDALNEDLHMSWDGDYDSWIEIIHDCSPEDVSDIMSNIEMTFEDSELIFEEAFEQVEEEFKES